jgi:predicted RNA binding protein YcfA (HicA-like mRNA interferase family)
MSRWAPCKRSEFIRRLRKLGFDGPYSGTRHHFMIHQQHRLTIPSNQEYSVSQLRMMLRELEHILGRSVTVEEWNSLS